MKENTHINRLREIATSISNIYKYSVSEDYNNIEQSDLAIYIEVVNIEEPLYTIEKMSNSYSHGACDIWVYEHKDAYMYVPKTIPAWKIYELLGCEHGVAIKKYKGISERYFQFELELFVVCNL